MMLYTELYLVTQVHMLKRKRKFYWWFSFWEFSPIFQVRGRMAQPAATPLIQPPSQGMAAGSSLCSGGPVMPPLLPRCPTLGEAAGQSHWNCFVSIGMFYWRLHVPRFMLPEGFVSWGLFSVGRSSSDTVPPWKAGTRSLDITGFVHIWKQSCNRHVADGFFEKHFFYGWWTNRT